MPWQFGKYNRRTFQYSFQAMEHFIKESRQLYDQIHSRAPEYWLTHSQGPIIKEKFVSQSVLIFGVAGIEALANCVLKEFSLRDKNSLPESMLSKNQRNNEIEFWRLIDKVYFLPTLCNKDFSPPAVYFKRDSTIFQKFAELIKIRNSMMHGRLSASILLIELKPGLVKEIDDDIEINNWPITGIKKDPSSFNYSSAQIAFDTISWVKGTIVKLVDAIDNNYLESEQITLISDIVETDADKAYLKSNFRDFIKPKYLKDIENDE